MKLIIIFLAFVFSTSAIAEDYKGSLSANQLLDMCNSKDALDKEKCKIFIMGVRSGMAAQRMFIGFTMATQKTDDPGKLLLALTTKEPICSEKELSSDELTNSFVKFMGEVKDKTPKLLNGGAGASVLLGMQKRFKCS